ncbi:Asp23/Gls24 family envelope stress response protein [Pseudonocardia bannensis]|uniref:Asp23/Gls24 family envelope stress response protein n=1 Tax=Pseudonocardia bannensis TaxID=630973 RepID=A0A848DQR4_9PSEU|nr:Asp23/Gls24 family envelope stress response protein [Pseudonocardia bannensis]NMH94731.1 Asp23/Gls24 family envelope stress response protein [Pseudonocardia bannensis]
MSTASPALLDPAERGHLDIHPTVLRKIIEHAADQVPGTLRSERRLAGLEVGETGANARVSTGSGAPDAVDVRLELTLGYPGRVTSVVDAVRSRISEELERLAGYRVRTLAVTVSGLRGEPAPPRVQ